MSREDLRFKPWCSIHYCHPDKCFYEHHPELIFQPFKEIEEEEKDEGDSSC